MLDQGKPKVMMPTLCSESIPNSLAEQRHLLEFKYSKHDSMVTPKGLGLLDK
jgi:hypothetical protein